MDNDGFHTVRGYQIKDQGKKLITPAMEDYLEMIYRISLQNGYIRINTLSEQLNIQAPSATKMMQKLKNRGLLNYEKYGIIHLTDSGKEIGKFLLDRHGVIENFLKLLGVKENLLIETELIEHNISADTLEKFALLNKFLSGSPSLVKKLERFIGTKPNSQDRDG